MKVLLVHSRDFPDRGPWSHERWDQIVDLGIAGWNAYERWKTSFRCPVVPIESLRAGLADFSRVRSFMRFGLGKMIDREGLDWWELIAIMLHENMDRVSVLRRLLDSLPSGVELHATRRGFYTTAVSFLRGMPVHVYPETSPPSLRMIAHYWETARKFPFSQLVEISADKYDSSYSVRKLFANRRRQSGKPVVLLPSAYVNVTRLALLYAGMLPDKDFLLVTMRRSGRATSRPSNVAIADIASYVGNIKFEDKEYRDLSANWKHLQVQLKDEPEANVLLQMGLFDSFPAGLKKGLILRNAWRSVFESEAVEAVLCGDDSNPNTHIPLLLAARRNIPTVVSHHGALDGRHLIKRNHADVILAKGTMEQDYLVNVCGVPARSIELGAPDSATDRVPNLSSEFDSKSIIVYFSESYEIMSGRTIEFYRDVLPPLADLSRRNGRRFVIKLHPAESLREREMLVRKLLSSAQMEVTRLVDGPLTEELLDQTWFGVTVLSSTAVDCAKRGIPCFFCKWLEYWPYGYIDQYERFGVGSTLASPLEIDGIPKALEKRSMSTNPRSALWAPISRDRLLALLGANTRAATQSS